MKFSFASARADPFDRNPTTRGNAFSSTTGPHGLTTRWTYTTPAGKKAFIQSFRTIIERITAAGAAGTFQADIQINGKEMGLVSTNANTANAIRDTAFSQGPTLSAGEAISGETADGSTGGTVFYCVEWFGVEFDA